MDWTGCKFVEPVPGKMSGFPVVVGTRVPPETFVEGIAEGMSLEELREDFPTVTLEQIQGIMAFARTKSLLREGLNPTKRFWANVSAV